MQGGGAVPAAAVLPMPISERFKRHEYFALIKSGTMFSSDGFIQTHVFCMAGRLYGAYIRVLENGVVLILDRFFRADPLISCTFFCHRKAKL